jgi:hypothetical protein
MLCVQHPNVLRIHNMIEDTVFNHRRWIMLVLELVCLGGQIIWPLCVIA